MANIVRYKGKAPHIALNSFIASTATIAGDVRIGEECSVWFGAVIRAESAPITINRGSNVQDNCVIHTDSNYPTIIGEGVTIGHGALIHGSRIGSNSLIGMGTIMLNGSEVGSNCIVGAGSLLLGKAFADDTLVLGSPATAKRKLSEEERKSISENARHYKEFRSGYTTR